MNTASLELSMELYKLSGWGETEHWQHVEGSYTQGCPSYDLGYLLRKLPYQNHEHNLELVPRHDGSWYIGYSQGIEDLSVGYEPAWLIYREADTPEDAACKLAIELFKQGILTKA